MSTVTRRRSVNALGLLALLSLSACVASEGGYVVGGVYEDPGYEYGGWGRGYHVAPPRPGFGGERRAAGSPQHAYRAPAPSRSMPSIPSGPRGR
jgi:hypothetical protein